MVKTGIFGGSFNPVHNGHVALASAIRKAAGLDEVWLMVTPQNPWKSQEGLLDDAKRLQLAQVAVEGIDGLLASDYEFGLPRPSYTWDTLQALSRDYPERRFTLVVGGDNWAKFDQWYAHDKILANYDVVVYPRKGSRISRATLPPNVRVLRTRLYNVSSTEIRERILQGLDIDALVPPRVAEIIKAEGLYLSE